MRELVNLGFPGVADGFSARHVGNVGRDRRVLSRVKIKVILTGHATGRIAIKHNGMYDVGTAKQHHVT